MIAEFKDKTIAVLGLARSGIACAEVLTELGARVRLYDQKTEEELGDAAAAARAIGIEPRLSGEPVDYSELDYLITSPGVRKNAPVLQQALAAGVTVWSEIEAAYRVARAPLLAITGTNGKTTTTVLLGEMLRAGGIKTWIAGNIAAGELAMPLIKAAHLAEPDAAIVAEISSFQLEWIELFRPRIAALLNITPDHQDRQTWEEYVAAKWRLFENQRSVDVAVLSRVLLEDPHSRAVRAQIEAFEDNFLDLDLSETKLPGRHNQDNILAAAAMAAAFGVDREAISQAAAAFQGVVHRLEYVGTFEKVRYINNSMCTNAAAFEKSLEAFPEPKVVIAGGVFKGKDASPLAKALTRNNVRALILIGRSALEIAEAAYAAGFHSVYMEQTLPDAVCQAKHLAHPGETVLFAPACASFDMFRDFEDRGERFKAAVSRVSFCP